MLGKHYLIFSFQSSLSAFYFLSSQNMKSTMKCGLFFSRVQQVTRSFDLALSTSVPFAYSCGIPWRLPFAYASVAGKLCVRLDEIFPGYV